ncbi:MAG: AI-2E family transporter [Bacillota bacterium]|nr:AI-2E family transporter [Bacillota bacterium]
MEKFKEMMKDRVFIKWSFFILFNAVLLYALYFIIDNIGWISSGLFDIIATILDAFWPLILGLILAYLLNPLSEAIDDKLMSKAIKLPDDPIKAEKRKNLRHFISVIITFLLVIAAVVAIIYGFAVMIVGRVVFENLSITMQDVFAGIAQYETSFKNWVAGNVPEGAFADKLTDIANSIMGWISENVNATSVINFFTDISGSLIDIVIAVIISIYLMKDKQFFLGLWRKFLHLVLPQKGNAVITETLSEVNGVLSRFIRGALLDALFVAILSSIGLSLMGLEAAVFIGVFAGIANVIPYFGPIMGMVPAFLMGFCTDGFWHGALAVLILLAVQQIDSNIIYPKVVGTSTGLHPLMVLLAVSVFGYFGGILGMLLAVPIAGVIQVFVVKWATSKEKKIQRQTPRS